jgi:HPt (histidine-containing phosphotransfer) domain-containing protein
MSIADTFSPDTHPTAYDFVDAIARLGGDAELFREIAEYFTVDSVELMDRLRTATANGDRKQVAAAAHALNGAASAFSAVRVTTEAVHIETAARNRDAALVGDLREIDAAVEELRAALRRLPDEACHGEDRS